MESITLYNEHARNEYEHLRELEQQMHNSVRDIDEFFLVPIGKNEEKNIENVYQYIKQLTSAAAEFSKDLDAKVTQNIELESERRVFNQHVASLTATVLRLVEQPDTIEIEQWSNEKDSFERELASIHMLVTATKGPGAPSLN